MSNFSSGTAHDRLTSFLDQANIEYRVLEHEAVTSSADAARARGVELQTGAKAMLVKAGGQFYLAVLAADHRLDWRKLERVVGAKKPRLASEDEVADLTHLPKGAIPPFGLIFDLPTILDETLLSTEVVRFNAGSLTRSVEMQRKDLVTLNGGEVRDFSKQ